ncbi:unnamed protein product, partial [Prorocentrum cordatum]
DQIMGALIGDKGKPPSFGNVKKPDYFDWSFKFKAFIGNQSRKALEGMNQVEYSQNALDYGNYDDERRQMPHSLYSMLTMYTEGTRLSYQCDPQNMGSILFRLMKVLEFDFGGESEFLDNLAKFENLIEEYEKLSKEALSDNIRSAVLIEDIQWNTIKKVTSYYLLTKQSMPGGPAPMGVGWTQTGGKWDRRPGKYGDWKGDKGRDSKGKGKDSKGKGADKGDKGGEVDGKPEFQGHCGRCGKWGHKQKGFYAKINEVDTGDWSSWNVGWNTDGWGKSWRGQQIQGHGDPAPAQPSKETTAAAATTASVECQVCGDESAWIFAVATYDGSKGTRVGQVVDAMVDAGENRSVCGPQDFPDYPIIQDTKLEIKVATGANIRHYGDKQVNLRAESDDEINVKIHVTDVTRPIPSVTSINIAGAGVEFPPSSARGSASITRDSKSGRQRLGLITAFGLLFLRATVMACAGAKHGGHGLVVNVAATDDATPFSVQEVDQPIEPAARPEATAVTAPRESTKAEREAHEARRDEKAHPVMNAINSAYHAAASVWCEAKGSGDTFVVKCLQRYVEKLGREKAIAQCGPENAAKDAAIKVARDVGNKAIGGKYGIAIELGRPIMAWIARHASWTHDRFLVHRSDYKTSLERQNEKHYDKKVAPLGEAVMRRQPGPIAAKFETAWGCGIHSGRSLEGDARICGARRGIIMARSARGLVESERCDKQLPLAMRGTPSDLKAADASDAEPAPEPERAAGSVEPQSAAGKISSDDGGAPAGGEAPPTERNIGAVTIANVTELGYPGGAELHAPCELDPNFELLEEACYDDDDGEHLDPNKAHEGAKRGANCMGPLGVGGPAPRPRDKEVWGTRWRHRKKGEGARSRFVARQFQDAQAGDFIACAPRTEAVRTPMAAALLLKRAAATTDFSAAFTRAPVKDGAGIYVEMPPAEPAIYHHIEKGVRVVVHADDPLAPGPARRVLDELFDKLAEHLVIMGRFVLGEEPVIYLGSSLQRFGDVIVEKSKPGRVESALEAAGMTGCRPVGTAGARPDLTEPGAKEPLNSEEHSLYRLDVMYPLRQLGWRLSEPRKADVKCLKHLFRYLNGTRDMAMVHRASNDWKRLRGSTDSDWAGCHESRKSTCCGIVRWCGAAISSHVRTESALAQSSPEAEYLGAVELAAEVLYVREIVRFMGFDASMEIECDATSAIAIATRRGLGRPRHHEVKWLWLQQLVGTGQIKIAKVKGIENAPDVGTKFLCKAALEKCRSMLGLAAVDGFGSAVVAALSAGRSARFLATLMIPVSGARAEPDQDRGGLEPLMMVMLAWTLSCVIIGLLFGYLRAHFRACTTKATTPTGPTASSFSTEMPTELTVETTTAGATEPTSVPPPVTWEGVLECSWYTTSTW